MVMLAYPLNLGVHLCPRIYVNDVAFDRSHYGAVITKKVDIDILAFNRLTHLNSVHVYG